MVAETGIERVTRRFLNHQLCLLLAKGTHTASESLYSQTWEINKKGRFRVLF